MVLVNAIVEGDFDLGDVEVSRSIIFEKCRMHSVNFSGAVFRRRLAFLQCNLGAFDAPQEVGGDLELNGSTMSGSLKICDSRIDGGVYADELKVKGANSGVCLSGTVAKNCSFTSCEFEGNVTCYGIKAGASIDFSDSKFRHLGGVNFSAMTVQGDLSLNDAHFTGPVTLSNSRINRDLSANNATFAFSSTDCDGCYYTPYNAYALSASDLRIAGNCYLNGTVSKGLVDLSGMSVGRGLAVADGMFEDTEKPVLFLRLKVNGPTEFSGSTFCGGLDLGNSELGDWLSLEDVTSEGALSVHNSRIASYVSVDRTELAENAPLDMVGTKAAGLNMESAVLLGEVTLQDFQSSGLVRFDDTWFMSKAPVDLVEAKVGNLSAIRTHFGGGMIAFHIYVSGSMDFTGGSSEGANGISCESSEVKANLILEQMSSEGDIDFTAANLGSVFFGTIDFLSPTAEAIFDGVTVTRFAGFQYTNGGLSLKEGRFNALRFQGITDAPERRLINLKGTRYNSLAVNGTDYLKDLLLLLRSSEVHVSAFANLEEYLKITGRQSDANEAFIAYRRTDAQQSDWSRRVWCWCLDVATGYGRHLERLGWCLIGFVGLGTIVFWSQSGMEPKGDSRSQAYNPFWYSLGLFLPFDNLGISREWVPRSDRWFARHYAHVQQLAGWIIVSIGIGILIGLR
jgi:hypothetical protein